MAVNPAIFTVPFLGKTPGTLQVQSILYNSRIKEVARALMSVVRSAESAIAAGYCSKVAFRYGDGSALPCLSKEEISWLKNIGGTTIAVEYDFFEGNLGTAKGHNRLAKDSPAEFILVQNPDVVHSPKVIETLLKPFRTQGVGMTEAKQLPIEHPKDYDPVTGETSWATTACAMISNQLFRFLKGFDSQSFFLYCDDVDFSWLVRHAGFKVIFQPAAIVYHDKRLADDGKWIGAGASETRYSAEGALFLTHKWSRPDLTEKYLDYFLKHGDQHTKKAAQAFLSQKESGTLVEPMDPDHNVGQFVGLNYSRHRFAL